MPNHATLAVELYLIMKSRRARLRTVADDTLDDGVQLVVGNRLTANGQATDPVLEFGRLHKVDGFIPVLVPLVANELVVLDLVENVLEVGGYLGAIDSVTWFTHCAAL